MKYQQILYEVRDHVATVTLNRTELHNAFNDEMIAELVEAFQTLDADNNIRVVVLAANGDVLAHPSLLWQPLDERVVVGDVLSEPRTVRLVNLAMALALAASLYPVLADAWR